jgi:hypothetical protein
VRQRHHQRPVDSGIPFGPFGGFAVGQVDDGLRPAQRLGDLAGVKLGAIGDIDSPTVKVGSPIDSTSAIVSEASRDASPTRP